MGHDQPTCRLINSYAQVSQGCKGVHQVLTIVHHILTLVHINMCFNFNWAIYLYAKFSMSRDVMIYILHGI